MIKDYSFHQLRHGMLRCPFLILSLLLALGSASYQHKQAANPIRVEGFVDHLPDGPVYLTDAYDGSLVVDSTTVTNGHFVFELAPDTAFVPFLASIRYPDSTQKDQHYRRHLVYLNPFESKGKSVSGTGDFFLGPAGALIKGQLNPAAADFLTIAAGQDNDLFQQLAGKGFGYITTRDPVNRPGRLHYFKRLIQQHPSSYFLLKGIMSDKENYTKKELADLLGLFEPQVQGSSVGQDLRTYFTQRKEATAPYHNLVLTDARQAPHPILDPKAKLNLLIFWASWCGPCRQEIPALQHVYQAFHAKGLHMASISIDKYATDWQKALGEEQMGWQQFIIAKDQLLQVEQQVNLRSIPVIILLDSSGHEITQKRGYSASEMAALHQAIAVGLQ